MSQSTNNILLTVVMLLVSATIVFAYYEYISQKIESTRSCPTQLKWVDDGSNKVLMIKEEHYWQVIPTELLTNKRYYPLNN